MRPRLGLVFALFALSVLAFTLAVAAAGSVPRHFRGFPPKGVKASTPTTGRLLIGFTTAGITWKVYADGRVIWQRWTPSGDATVVPQGARRLDTGFVQQRLTLQGVRVLRSKVLATGLFEHNLRLAFRKRHGWVLHRVRRGDRLVTVSGVPSPDPSWKEPFTNPTPAQTRALAWIENLVADPARSLPTSAWADRHLRAFVPARYLVAFDRSYPEKLPSPAGNALAKYKPLKRHACQILGTGQARALLQAFIKAGISPSKNHAETIGFDFAGLGLREPSWLHLHPALPEDVRC